MAMWRSLAERVADACLMVEWAEELGAPEDVDEWRKRALEMLGELIEEAVRVRAELVGRARASLPEKVAGYASRGEWVQRGLVDPLGEAAPTHLVVTESEKEGRNE